MAKTIGEAIAESLPVRDDDCDSDLISLVDIVITGIETGWTHFWVHNYDAEADGVEKPWAEIHDFEQATMPRNPVKLYADTVREAVAKYIDTRISAGMAYPEAAKLVDGSYTDAVISDSILQFALYGEEIYS